MMLLQLVGHSEDAGVAIEDNDVTAFRRER
jgi:hypothetical protein